MACGMMKLHIGVGDHIYKSKEFQSPSSTGRRPIPVQQQPAPGNRANGRASREAGHNGR